MKLDPSRLGWLAIVHDNTGLSRVSFTKDARGVAEWDIDGYGIRGGYASRDLWWLWEAGFIKFTRASYPTAVIATEKGVQQLMERGVIDWPQVSLEGVVAETPSGWTREKIVNFATWYLDERDGERSEASIRAEVEAAIGGNKNLGVSGA